MVDHAEVIGVCGYRWLWHDVRMGGCWILVIVGIYLHRVGVVGLLTVS